MQILEKTNLKGLEEARRLEPLGVVETIRKKNVVGRGGGAYPVAKKWKSAMDVEASERFLVCNADEGEPGTFKDRFIMKKNPETLIEGIIIAAETISAKSAFIYLRGEYYNLKKGLEKVIKKVTKDSKTEVKIEIVVGAGSYVCGEETAILKSIEGFRGQPYYKPPYPTVEGIRGKPTVVNNVETLTNVAQALAFENYDTKLRLFSVSGAVNKPGVYEYPLGTNLSEVVGKAEPRNNPKAIYFGCFGGCMKYKEMEMTLENICGEDCSHGAFTIIVVDDKTRIIDVALTASKFFTHESCGKCTPCREGNIQLLLLLKKFREGNGTRKDLETIKEFAKHIQETSLCGLGQTSANHFLTALEHFPEEFEDLIKNEN
jgi:NADH:ubiquinone oxidoreductase subunit F (NADH-binding)